MIYSVQWSSGLLLVLIIQTSLQGFSNFSEPQYLVSKLKLHVICKMLQIKLWSILLFSKTGNYFLFISILKLLNFFSVMTNTLNCTRLQLYRIVIKVFVPHQSSSLTSWNILALFFCEMNLIKQHHRYWGSNEDLNFHNITEH